MLTFVDSEEVGGDNSGCREEATGVLLAEAKGTKAVVAAEEKKGLIIQILNRKNDCLMNDY